MTKETMRSTNDGLEKTPASSGDIGSSNPLYQEILFECKPYYTAHYQMQKHQERCIEEGKKPQYTELKNFIAAIKTWESAKEFVERRYLVPLAWEGYRKGDRGVIFDPSWEDILNHSSGCKIQPLQNIKELYRPIFQETKYQPILLISGEAESQLYNHLNDYFARGMAVAQSEDAYRKSQSNPYRAERLLTDTRQSRHVQYSIEVDDGVMIQIELRLPPEAWEIASAIRGVPLRRDHNNNYRLPGWEIHDDMYPWIADAVREVVRKRKKEGIDGGRRDDTYAQHLEPQLWYPAIMKMLGKMEMAYALTMQKVTEGHLPPGKMKPFYKTLLATDIKVIGIDVSIPGIPGSVTLHENGNTEIHAPTPGQLNLI